MLNNGANLKLKSFLVGGSDELAVGRERVARSVLLSQPLDGHAQLGEQPGC